MVGMIIRHYRPEVSQKVEPLLNKFAVVFLALLIIGVSYQQREKVKVFAPISPMARMTIGGQS